MILEKAKFRNPRLRHRYQMDQKMNESEADIFLSYMWGFYILLFSFSDCDFFF